MGCNVPSPAISSWNKDASEYLPELVGIERKLQFFCVYPGYFLVNTFASCDQQWLSRCFILFCLFLLKLSKKETYSK